MDDIKRLAGFAVDFKLDMAPPDIVAATRFAVLDSVGSALGAAKDLEILSIVESLDKWTGVGALGSSSIWGQGLKLNPFAALMANGLMAHALELDDVHAESKSHIGAVVVPAAWTVSEALDISGRTFLEAVIVGYEVMARTGMSMDIPSNRRRGWHTTGIIGTFGAAAATARLIGLNKKEMLSAFGIAGTPSAGLWAFLAEGARCKKLNPARAAVNGLTAAIFAQSGMTGPSHILDAEDGGLFRAVSDGFDLTMLGLGRTYAMARIDKNLILAAARHITQSTPRSVSRKNLDLTRLR